MVNSISGHLANRHKIENDIQEKLKDISMHRKLWILRTFLYTLKALLVSIYALLEFLTGGDVDTPTTIGLIGTSLFVGTIGQSMNVKTIKYIREDITRLERERDDILRIMESADTIRKYHGKTHSRGVVDV